jgi:F420-dependent oxidoreductase-like protein
MLLFMRFGLFVPQGWRLDLTGIDPADHWTAMLAVARAAENGPFESVWVYDHFHTVPVPTEEATHEAWTLMAALGASTSRVRLGQMCTCMGYRNPAYLAKVAATVDIVSGGRVEMGIGAGWYEHEWRAYGYGFPGAGERLGQLDEGVQIMRQLWTTGTATLDGKHYQVDGAICRPLPLQEGGIPLWIAGGGEKKTLRIAAKYASYTNFDGSPEGFRHKSEILAGHCRDVGTDFDAIVRSSNYNVVIGETEKDAQDRLAWIRSHYEPYVPAAILEENHRSLANGPLVGTPEQIVERLAEAQDLGMTYAILNFAEAAYDLSGVELFNKQVAPALADISA